VSTSEENDRDGLAALNRAYTAIVDEARAQVAAGREPSLDALEARLRETTRRALSTPAGLPGPTIEKAQNGALRRLRQVAAVFRARALLTREPVPPRVATPAPRSAPSLRSRLKIRPTITGNMDVKRASDGDRLTLSWSAVPAVVEWEIRFSERPDPRGKYLPLDTLTLPPAQTDVDVPIGEHLYRVNILGRSRDGRPLQRALISGLARETWNDRWERRASAA
jgi:hypothetical protein